VLEKHNLPGDYIDLAVGEATIVKDVLLSMFDVSYKVDDFAYQSPAGYRPLVAFLEDKHNAPVVMCAGAKQALCASFYALKQMGKSSIHMRTPYWALLPQIIEMYGLNWNRKDYDSILIVNPNNPDNYVQDIHTADFVLARCAEKDIPVIHDAVYYNRVYMQDHPLKPFGNVQLFSFSKYLGLSGLRIGYAVCYDNKFYPKIKEYVEATTVGVSVASQQLIYSLLCTMKKDKEKTKEFEDRCKSLLIKNKVILKSIRQDVLEVSSNIEDEPGMFAWLKVGPKCDFEKARIHTVDGKLFGVNGMVRLNLGLPAEIMTEAVERLNSL
jgi:aspartate/methionine/tyrosine aminotransferase